MAPASPAPASPAPASPAPASPAPPSPAPASSAPASPAQASKPWSRAAAMAAHAAPASPAPASPAPASKPWSRAAAMSAPSTPTPQATAGSAPAAAPAAVPQGGTVAAEYMVSDAMIEEFYQKTISGSGGLPPKGMIMDLVIKHFLGSFDAKTKSFTRTSTYKGPPPQLPGKKDLPPAMELLKEQMKSPAFVTKGGPALDETG